MGVLSRCPSLFYKMQIVGICIQGRNEETARHMAFTMEAVSVLGLVRHDVEDRVDEFCALSDGVVVCGHAVAGVGLAIDEISG
jgi:hypothetical protein